MVFTAHSISSHEYIKSYRLITISSHLPPLTQAFLWMQLPFVVSLPSHLEYWLLAVVSCLLHSVNVPSFGEKICSTCTMRTKFQNIKILFLKRESEVHSMKQSFYENLPSKITVLNYSRILPMISQTSPKSCYHKLLRPGYINNSTTGTL